MESRSWIAALAVGLLLFGGCETESGKLASAHGKVFYRGEPVRIGTIVFTPDSVRGSAGPIATAEIQPDGSYSLRTEGVSGAAPGWHRVTVVSIEEAGMLQRSLLPARYRDPEQSGLTFEIQSGQDNLIHINLE